MRYVKKKQKKKTNLMFTLKKRQAEQEWCPFKYP